MESPVVQCPSSAAFGTFGYLVIDAVGGVDVVGQVVTDPVLELLLADAGLGKIQLANQVEVELADSSVRADDGAEHDAALDVDVGALFGQVFGQVVVALFGGKEVFHADVELFDGAAEKLGQLFVPRGGQGHGHEISRAKW